MPLPDVERVIYKRNPLVEVVGQLRFPQILKIANYDPVEFQDAIRIDYPILEISKGVVGIDAAASEVASDPQRLDTIYHFRTEDFHWRASLSRHFIALTTINYQRYEEFKHRFRAILEAFETIYHPPFYSRVGLRYQDLIVRSSLELGEVDWSELLPIHIAPELHIPGIVNSVVASTKTLVMRMGTGQVAFRHGLVEARDEENRIELAYLLDADFFSEGRVGVGSYVWERLDEYNQSARKLFRWSIQERLHLAMEPHTAPGEATLN
jgi:uncharacterized protein (TIGR04255 family)